MDKENKEVYDCTFTSVAENIDRLINSTVDIVMPIIDLLAIMLLAVLMYIKTKGG